ncbi:hypothetical protein JYU17_00815 [Flavobacteriaceae bacterium AH-315-O20]|nr:hypothetical protein [Flavobacteriaceae bacterium AH-315-O20]
MKAFIEIRYIGIINKYFILIFIAISLTLSGCKKNDKESKEGEIIIDVFYKNQTDYKVLDTLISYRFYQTTPYSKFKEFMIEKDNSVGDFKSKELIKVKTSINNYLLFEYKVNYDKKSTTEIFRLEKEQDKYKIVRYNVK